MGMGFGRWFSRASTYVHNYQSLISSRTSAHSTSHASRASRLRFYLTAHMSSQTSRPIIIVTGANSGVGFGICHRLLLQLSAKTLEDARPKYAFHNVSPELEGPEIRCDGLTLIMACRSKQRAEVSRTRLYDLVDEHVHRLKHSQDYDGHAEIFRKNLNIAIHTIDLSHIQSVFRFADEISQTYPYVSHLICNAGLAGFARIDWPLAIWQLLTDWATATTTARYCLQNTGDVSQDGLGWVWQCNVFGHYVLFRGLEPILAKYTNSTGSRVVWISSHGASSEFYDPTDWQLVKTGHPYDCSKYQMNQISLYLDREATHNQVDGKSIVRHFTVLPGVAATNIANGLLGKFTWVGMCMASYIARLLGSPYHTITAFKASISAVHLSLVPLTFLPVVSKVESSTNPVEPVEVGALYVSETDWWGRERVGTMKLVESNREEAQTRELLDKCDRLLKTFCDVEGRNSPSG
ncbi:NAD(P)-binding protein [Paxillus ammoniavirescens]|nr:NAD(P)-binding protein [Paxillus ammoniavirescens]